MTKQEINGLLKSKTFWFNSLTLIVEVSALLSGIVSPGVITSIVAVANIGLRVITKQSLSEKGL